MVAILDRLSSAINGQMDRQIEKATPPLDNELRNTLISRDFGVAAVCLGVLCVADEAKIGIPLTAAAVGITAHNMVYISKLRTAIQERTHPIRQQR